MVQHLGWQWLRDALSGGWGRGTQRTILILACIWSVGIVGVIWWRIWVHVWWLSLVVLVPILIPVLVAVLRVVHALNDPNGYRNVLNGATSGGNNLVNDKRLRVICHSNLLCIYLTLI